MSNTAPAPTHRAIPEPARPVAKASVQLKVRPSPGDCAAQVMNHQAEDRLARLGIPWPGQG